MEKNSMNEIERKFNLLEDKIEAHKAKVTSANDKLASQDPNPAESFIHMKMGEDAEIVAKTFMEDTKKNITVSDIEFQPDRKLLQQLKQKENIGKLKEKTMKSAGNLLQITEEESYCVKVESDDSETKCDISSACYMEDGRIILADYNNNKLKRLDSTSYTITDCCDLPGGPWQICKINETQVAVTLPSEKRISVISLKRQMKRRRMFKTVYTCHGLAYANNELYVSDDTSVYIYTMTGMWIKQFKTDYKEYRQFANMSSLAVSKDASRIYVVDHHGGMIVLDKNGKVDDTFNGNQFKAATCCHLTEVGSVLVFDSSKVLQFTSDGELIGEVIKENSEKEGIQSLCCNQQMSKMCINREEDDNIEVYDI